VCRITRHKEEFRLGADDNKNVNRIDGCRRRGRRHCRQRSALTNEQKEDKDLICEQATTTKESVAGTTTNERRTVDWIDDAGLSLELADEQHKSVAGSTGEEQKNLSLG